MNVKIQFKHLFNIFGLCISVVSNRESANARALSIMVVNESVKPSN